MCIKHLSLYFLLRFNEVFRENETLGTKLRALEHSMIEMADRSAQLQYRALHSTLLFYTLFFFTPNLIFSSLLYSILLFCTLYYYFLLHTTLLYFTPLLSTHFSFLAPLTLTYNTRLVMNNSSYLFLLPFPMLFFSILCFAWATLFLSHVFFHVF